MSKSSSPALSRRGMLVGAGTAGAAVVAVAALPLTPKATPVAVAVAPEAAPEQGGGYRLSPHVMRYYQTAKV
ncbi:MAG: formate dehydrogenase [Rubrivivax sp.]|nr:formate dehydrogenase [Rubrivivax sp.]